MNLSQFLQKPQNNFPKTIVVEQLNFSFLEKKEPFCIFFSIFTKLIIKNLAYVPTEKDPNFKSSDLKYYLGLILLNDIANCKRMPSKKNKIIDLFPQIYRKNQKMKNILKKIDFKIKDISLKHSMNQGEKVKSIIKQLNESIARVYLPSKDLTLIEKIINYYPKKTLRLLCLIDLKTNFFVKLMVESYNCDFNQDVLNLLQGFCHKDYTLYLRESFSNSKLFIILKTQGIKTFGIRNSQFLKEIYPFSCEVLKNQEGLYLCVLKDINVITNLSEFEIARRIAIDSANLPSDNDLFTFFEKKYKMIQSIKSSNILKVFDQAEIYERFLRIVVDIALHNGFLINSRYEVGEKLSSDDFQMKVIENLLGVK